MADGTIPDNQKQLLLAIGDWMKKYGEAIYDTRPFVAYGEGPTKMLSSGSFVKMQSGYNENDIRYTRKNDIVYAMTLGQPNAGSEVKMTIFGKEGKAANIKVNKITMLGTKQKIKWQRTDEGLILKMPADGNEIANVFKLNIKS
jgi:alpha-L-fucosidase